MKKIIIFSFAILFSTFSYSQITLEHTYKGSGLLRFVELEQDGIKYMQPKKQIPNTYDYDSTVYLYNLDHSIYKMITIPSSSKIYLITQNLFNFDSKLELLCSGGDYNQMTKLFSEDGLVIFSDTGKFNLDFSYGNKGAIKNTPTGTKMILQEAGTSQNTSRVYSLPGKLISSVDNGLKINKENLFPFPNPSNNIINIPYQINSNAIASVTITDMLGKVVKTYKIDNTFNSLLVNLDDFSAGTYVYTIQKENDPISQGKFIVSK